MELHRPTPLQGLVEPPGHCRSHPPPNHPRLQTHSPAEKKRGECRIHVTRMEGFEKRFQYHFTATNCVNSYSFKTWRSRTIYLTRLTHPSRWGCQRCNAVHWLVGNDRSSCNLTSECTEMWQATRSSKVHADRSQHRLVRRKRSESLCSF